MRAVRCGLLRTVVVAACLAGVAVAALPGAAATDGLAPGGGPADGLAPGDAGVPDTHGPGEGVAATHHLGSGVAESRAAWEAAEQALERAEAAYDDLTAALVDAEEAEAQAAADADAQTALLVQRERELEFSDTALRDAEAATAEALAVQRRALQAYEQALVRALERRAELGVAAASAYTNGDPRLKALNGLVHAFDQARSVTDFLNASERLSYVTRDARDRLDVADDDVAERAGDALVATAVLQGRHEDEAAATAARDAARDVAERQRARRDEALAAHDEAVERVAELRAALGAAEAALALAHEELAGAVTVLEGLGWLAGVPGTHGLVWPVDGRPGSGFGMRLHPIHGELRRHLGVDVGAPTGQPIVAAAGGQVVHAGPRGGYGITVIVDHGDGLTTLYAHLSQLAVSRGETVDQAALIGYVGSTGQSTGPHLHFEVREDGRHVDPLDYFR